MNVLKYAFQDIKRQKVKTVFAVGGIFISVLLLTLVGSLNDSLAYSYLDQATYTVGSADFVFNREQQQDINFNSYFNYREFLDQFLVLIQSYPIYVVRY